MSFFAFSVLLFCRSHHLRQAPELHLEILRQLANQQAPLGGASASNVKKSKKKKNSDLKYDILGWVILGIAVIAWVGMAKSQLPPPPSR